MKAWVRKKLDESWLRVKLDEAKSCLKIWAKVAECITLRPCFICGEQITCQHRELPVILAVFAREAEKFLAWEPWQAYGTIKDAKTGKALRKVMEIHPAVLSATADELIAAGYGEIPRDQIPPDWREKPILRSIRTESNDQEDQQDRQDKRKKRQY